MERLIFDNISRKCVAEGRVGVDTGGDRWMSRAGFQCEGIAKRGRDWRASDRVPPGTLYIQNRDAGTVMRKGGNCPK